jgi:hypothetical protein
MGFYVDHMVCNMSGEHKLAINKSIEACTDTCKKTDGESVDKPCCDYDSNYFQEDVPVNPTQKTQKQFSAFKFIAVSAFIQLKSDVESSDFLVQDDVPIPSVRRHILFETYLI